LSAAIFCWSYQTPDTYTYETDSPSIPRGALSRPHAVARTSNLCQEEFDSVDRRERRNVTASMVFANPRPVESM
jgi:hypothetical protein